jgi:plasmid stabilization system protein ParE
MARVVLTRKAAEQIAAFRAFYEDKDPMAGERAVTAILAAFRRLESYPLIGRPFRENALLRELVIPFGRTGFVALYRSENGRQRVVILAIRHQREAGYGSDQGTS